jgi:cytochrome c biogenesis protein CcmG/thiol:disulfide interchange protein DsbE
MSSSASTELPARRGMSPGRRRWVSLAIGLVLAAAVWVGLTSFAAPASVTVHPFSLPRLGSGPRVRVPIVGEGAHDPVVVTFFASWCGPCHAELPALSRVVRQAQAAGDKVRFIGIDGNDAPASGLAFARQSGVDFPVGRDALSLVAPTFGIQGYPATVFIDADGDIASTVRGPIKVATLEAGITRIDRT